MTYLGVGVGKSLPPETLAVYFDCLGDLEYEVLALAAKRVLLNHRYPTFPTIAELREAAAGVARGRVKELSPGEAWALAWGAVKRIDPALDASVDRATKGLPPLVVKAMQAFGICALCGGGEP